MEGQVWESMQGRAVLSQQHWAEDELRLEKEKMETSIVMAIVGGRGWCGLCSSPHIFCTCTDPRESTAPPGIQQLFAPARGPEIVGLKLRDPGFEVHKSTLWDRPPGYLHWSTCIQSKEKRTWGALRVVCCSCCTNCISRDQVRRDLSKLACSSRLCHTRVCACVQWSPSSVGMQSKSVNGRLKLNSTHRHLWWGVICKLGTVED
jgi:hypothetical protein